ncbi:Uncharacterised protein [Helicobacter cholecystus]|nr:Uncharacterised protein [Helicobacter cholecystus]
MKILNKNKTRLAYFKLDIIQMSAKEGRFLVRGGGSYGDNNPSYKALSRFGRASKSFS